jgi:hypothetical protein
MFLHLHLFILPPLEQFDILNLKIISYILFFTSTNAEVFMILTLLFLSSFFNRRRRRAILNVNFLFFAFNYEDTHTAVTPDIFIFRKHMFKFLENPNFAHIQTNYSQNPQIAEVAHHFWVIQDLDKLQLWLEVNNIAINNIASTTTPYGGFWSLLLAVIFILSVLSVGTICILPELATLVSLECLTVAMVSLAEHNLVRSEELWFAMDIEDVMAPQEIITADNLSFTSLVDHNVQVGRSEELWFAMDIDEYYQRIFDQISIERHVQSMERQRLMIEGQRICAENVARHIKMVHDADLAHAQYVASRLPTIHDEMIHDRFYFRRIYWDHFLEFGNLNVHGLLNNQNIGIDHSSYDSLRLNFQRLSLGQYNRVDHSFMLRLTASEVEVNQSVFAPPPANLAFREDFHEHYIRYRTEIHNEYTRRDLRAPRPDLFYRLQNWH